MYIFIIIICGVFFLSLSVSLFPSLDRGIGAVLFVQRKIPLISSPPPPLPLLSLLLPLLLSSHPSSPFLSYPLLALLILSCGEVVGSRPNPRPCLTREEGPGSVGSFASLRADLEEDRAR